MRYYNKLVECEFLEKDGFTYMIDVRNYANPAKGQYFLTEGGDIIRSAVSNRNSNDNLFTKDENDNLHLLDKIKHVFASNNPDFTDLPKIPTNLFKGLKTIKVEVEIFDLHSLPIGGICLGDEAYFIRPVVTINNFVKTSF